MVFSRKSSVILIGITVVLVAYLFHVPNARDVAQINRIRVISATMKIVKFIGQVSESIGLWSQVDVQRSIEVIMKILKPTDQDADLEITEETIDEVPVRIYRSRDSKEGLRPAFVYFHGGAYYLGSYDSHDAITSRLARFTGSVVISVHYRLAPEHPFPAGVDDCTAVTKYILDKNNAKNLAIDHEHVAIGGDSAGGNFAAVVARRLAMDEHQQTKPRLLLMIYPNVQLFDFKLPSYVEPTLQIFHFATMSDVLRYYFNRSITDAVNHNLHLTVEQKKRYRKYVDWSLIPDRYRQNYKAPVTDDIEGNPELINSARQVLNVDVSPLLVKNDELAKMPRTYILTVEHDGLRDEGFIYAARLKASGVSVTHHHFLHAFHGSLAFLDGPLALDVGSEMLNDITKFFNEHVLS